MGPAIPPAYLSIGIYSNLIDMTKFEGASDPGFVSLTGEVRRWVKELEAPLVRSFSPSPQNSILEPASSAPTERSPQISSSSPQPSTSGRKNNRGPSSLRNEILALTWFNNGGIGHVQ